LLIHGASAVSGRALIVGINSSTGNTAHLTTGGTWTNVSDKNLKDSISSIDNAEVLNKVMSLEITKWKYKGTEEYHIGPMAQDFYDSFHLGLDEHHISTVDPSGIALASIKALKAENDALKRQLLQQAQDIASIKKMLESKKQND